MTIIHRNSRGRSGITAVCALFALVSTSRAASAAVIPSGAAVPGLAGAFAEPVFFEPNLGQAPASVRFLSRGATQNLLVTDEGLWFQHSGGERVGLTFAGAGKIDPKGADQLPGVSHYYLGAGSAPSGVPHFGRFVSPALYPSIDLVAYAHDHDLEYDLVVAPGGDPRQIRLRFPGASRLTLDAAGDLLIETSSGTVRNGRPVAYQPSTDAQGKSEPVAARYQIRRNGEIGIALGRYDHRRPLVIDPVLSTTKRPAGSGNEQVTDIAVDASGNVYVTGFTEGRGFPTLNGYQTTIRGDVDAFVAKYNSSGTLIYSTYYGGNGEDVGRAIAIDGTGRAYVVGATKSTNLAVVNAFQGSKPLGECSFLLVLSAAGNSLVYATYLGGTSNSTIVDVDNNVVTIPPQVRVADVGVGMDGSMWVTGETTSTTFPFTIRGFQPTYGGGNYDAFVMRVNPGNGSVGNFSFYGGPGIDRGRRLARRGDQVPVGGDTYSTLNVGHIGPEGDSSVFVLAIYDSGFGYAGAKRIGGSKDENLRGLAVDSNRNVYLSGETLSEDLPVTAGAGQRERAMREDGGAARYDAFVVKLNANADTIVYATYLGGKSMEMNGDLAVSPSGTAYVTGTSYSNDFPRIPSASVPLQGNFFVTQLNATGGFVYSALLGGSAADAATGIAVSGSNLWIGGTSLSSSFPGAPGAAGNWDGLLTKMTLP